MWKSFFELIGRHGRRGDLFIWVFLTLCLIAPFGGGIERFFQEHVDERVLAAGILLFTVSTAGLVIRHCCRKAEKVTVLPPLSREDWRVARSKLLKKRT